MTIQESVGSTTRPAVAVLVPRYNEAATIETVVRSFRKSRPEAHIYVYDNNSTDGTAEIAA
jgi:glycosyltransferase involved in cell wall biosynthesis